MAAERRMSVDWPACKGHGLCAELVPELIKLDEWGYPILADRPVTRGVQSHAQRAVAACPTLALSLVEKDVLAGSPSPARDDPISGAIRAATGPNPVQRRRPPAEDPITGAIRAVNGPNAVQRRTPPTGTARHATPAYGQSAFVPQETRDERYMPVFDENRPERPAEPAFGRPAEPPTDRGFERGFERPVEPGSEWAPEQPSGRRARREQSGTPEPAPDQRPAQPRTRREARERR